MAWRTIESNPDVMNELLDSLGVPKKWHVEDIYGIDPDLLATVTQPVLAVILLFPLSEKVRKFMKEEEEKALTEGDNCKDLIYLKQFTPNACGTIALIHSVVNNVDSIKLSEGPLKEFLNAIQGLDPEEAGKELMEQYDIARAHDKVAEEGQTEAPDANDDCEHHYVAFVEKKGNLYELDGRKRVPIKHCPTSKDTFLLDAANVIKKFMDSDPENIQFTMMALTAACT